MNVQLISEAIILVASATGAFTDANTGKIPNWITYPCLLIGPLLHTLSGSWRGLTISAIGIGVASVIPLLLFFRNAMGGGDLKLLAALGGLAGPLRGVEIELYSMIVTAVCALFMLTWQGHLFRTLSNTLNLAFNPLRPKARRAPIEPTLLTSMRMGIPIFLACLWAIGSQWVVRGVL